MKTQLGLTSKVNVSVGLLAVLYASIVLVRLFTETIPILPEVFEYSYDLLVPVGALILLLPRIRSQYPLRSYGLVSCLSVFILVWLISAVANRDVHFVSALAFLVMCLEGPIWFLILANLPWQERDIDACVLIVTALGLLQVLIGLVQVPYGMLKSNPDVVSGTFGENSSQLSFFLGIFTFLLLARYSCGEISLKRVSLLVTGTVVVFFAAGFRGLWISYLLTAVLVVILGGKLSRRQILGVVATLLACSALAIFAVGQAVERFAEVIHIDLTKLGKVEATANILSLYRSQPLFSLVGCGPGTFSSRSWMLFDRIGESGSSHFDISEEANWGSTPSAGMAWYKPGFYSSYYTLPIYQKPVVLLGSSTVDGPFTSYVSLPAEVGLLGAGSLLAAYFSVARRLWLIAKSRQRSAAPIAVATLAGFLLLFQMCAFDNWLEVGRVTILVWALAAVPIAHYSLRARTSAGVL